MADLFPHITAKRKPEAGERRRQPPETQETAQRAAGGGRRENVRVPAPEPRGGAQEPRQRDTGGEPYKPVKVLPFHNESEAGMTELYNVREHLNRQKSDIIRRAESEGQSAAELDALGADLDERIESEVGRARNDILKRQTAIQTQNEREEQYLADRQRYGAQKRRGYTHPAVNVLQTALFSAAEIGVNIPVNAILDSAAAAEQAAAGVGRIFPEESAPRILLEGKNTDPLDTYGRDAKLVIGKYLHDPVSGLFGDVADIEPWDDSALDLYLKGQRENSAATTLWGGTSYFLELLPIVGQSRFAYRGARAAARSATGVNRRKVREFTDLPQHETLLLEEITETGRRIRKEVRFNNTLIGRAEDLDTDSILAPITLPKRGVDDMAKMSASNAFAYEAATVSARSVKRIADNPIVKAIASNSPEARIAVTDALTAASDRIQRRALNLRRTLGRTNMQDRIDRAFDAYRTGVADELDTLRNTIIDAGKKGAFRTMRNITKTGVKQYLADTTGRRAPKKKKFARHEKRYRGAVREVVGLMDSTAFSPARASVGDIQAPSNTPGLSFARMYAMQKVHEMQDNLYIVNPSVRTMRDSVKTDSLLERVPKRAAPEREGVRVKSPEERVSETKKRIKDNARNIAATLYKTDANRYVHNSKTLDDSEKEFILKTVDGITDKMKRGTLSSAQGNILIRDMYDSFIPNVERMNDSVRRNVDYMENTKTDPLKSGVTLHGIQRKKTILKREYSKLKRAGKDTTAMKKEIDNHARDMESKVFMDNRWSAIPGNVGDGSKVKLLDSARYHGRNIARGVRASLIQFPAQQIYRGVRAVSGGRLRHIEDTRERSSIGRAIVGDRFRTFYTGSIERTELPHILDVFTNRLDPREMNPIIRAYVEKPSIASSRVGNRVRYIVENKLDKQYTNDIKNILKKQHKNKKIDRKTLSKGIAEWHAEFSIPLVVYNKLLGFVTGNVRDGERIINRLSSLMEPKNKDRLINIASDLRDSINRSAEHYGSSARIRSEDVIDFLRAIIKNGKVVDADLRMNAVSAWQRKIINNDEVFEQMKKTYFGYSRGYITPEFKKLRDRFRLLFGKELPDFGELYFPIKSLVKPNYGGWNNINSYDGGRIVFPGWSADDLMDAFTGTRTPASQKDPRVLTAEPTGVRTGEVPYMFDLNITNLQSSIHQQYARFNASWEYFYEFQRFMEKVGDTLDNKAANLIIRKMMQLIDPYSITRNDTSVGRGTWFDVVMRRAATLFTVTSLTSGAFLTGSALASIPERSRALMKYYSDMFPVVSYIMRNGLPGYRNQGAMIRDIQIIFPDILSATTKHHDLTAHLQGQYQVDEFGKRVKRRFTAGRGDEALRRFLNSDDSVGSFVLTELTADNYQRVRVRLAVGVHEWVKKYGTMPNTIIELFSDDAIYKKAIAESDKRFGSVDPQYKPITSITDSGLMRTMTNLTMFSNRFLDDASAIMGNRRVRGGIADMLGVKERDLSVYAYTDIGSFILDTIEAEVIYQYGKLFGRSMINEMVGEGDETDTDSALVNQAVWGKLRHEYRTVSRGAVFRRSRRRVVHGYG